MEAKKMIGEMENGKYDSMLLDIYMDKGRLPYQKQRYIGALNDYIAAYGNDDVEIYSAPGRSEIGGNHTDHQHGEVFAAAVSDDAIAVVKALEGRNVKVISNGYDMLIVDLDHIGMVEEEKGTTISLIKGVLYKMAQMGYQTGGFQAYITSDVLIGAGLSSSAAYETLIGTILSGLYNDGKVSATEIAIIGQFAENVYFGKPCGLMDQMICATGNMVHVDFANPLKPKVETVDFDLEKHGYSLCITDTKGSHTDLTADYAAVPKEMKEVAAYFGKEVLLGLSVNDILREMDGLRKKAGDRGVLRALHFISENERVKQEVCALQNGDMDGFLKLVEASGNSSYKYLQNIYSNADIRHQNVSLAYAISEAYLGENGVCRVHGGGFAGTIQAFVKKEAVDGYRERMDAVFGKGSCNVLKIRKYGGMRVL